MNIRNTFALLSVMLLCSCINQIDTANVVKCKNAGMAAVEEKGYIMCDPHVVQEKTP